jgi:mannose/fructose/N-acetylgalactosamine-specific phosphotransferase system component IIC
MAIDDVAWSASAMVTVLPVAVLGAVCGLDVVSFPQAMISRPIVAATAAGALAGDASAGLLVGAALELIAQETLPVGASRYPEWGSASVFAGTLAAAAPAGSPATIPVTILAALATAAVGGWSMVALRRWNATRARTNLEALERGSARTVNGLQLGGLTADMVRGAALTVAALLVLSPLVHAAATRWAVGASTSVAVVAGTVAAIAAAAVWRLFHGIPGTRWLFGAGLLGGLALVVWR